MIIIKGTTNLQGEIRDKSARFVAKISCETGRISCGYDPQNRGEKDSLPSLNPI